MDLSYQEIEELVEKLHKDALVVEQVRAIVKEDEEIMAAETQTVEEYAQVYHITIVFHFYCAMLGICSL